MSEVNCCPFCDAPQHKIMACKENLFHCKTCHKFFELKEIKLKCLKCASNSIVKSDFPAPTGEAVFQCRLCKKMFSAKEFFEQLK